MPLACRQWEASDENADQPAPGDCPPRRLAAQSPWNACTRFSLARCQWRQNDASGVQNRDIPRHITQKTPFIQRVTMTRKELKEMDLFDKELQTLVAKAVSLFKKY